MQYPVRLVVPSLAFISLLALGSMSSAGDKLPEMRLRPCTLQVPPQGGTSQFELRLRIDRDARSTPAAPNQDTEDLVLGMLAIKRGTKGTFGFGVEDVEAARWRWVRSTISDVRRGQRDYSVVGVLPTACLAAGALTLAWQAGRLGAVKIAAKTWRAGGVLGVQASF